MQKHKFFVVVEVVGGGGCMVCAFIANQSESSFHTCGRVCLELKNELFFFNLEADTCMHCYDVIVHVFHVF